MRLVVQDVARDMPSAEVMSPVEYSGTSEL